MASTARRFVSFVLVLILGFGVTVSARAASDAAAPSDTALLHFINRISFGAAPGDLEAVRRVGVTDYLELQLHPEFIHYPFILQERLSHIESLNLSPEALMENYQPKPEVEKALTDDQRKEVERRKNEIVKDLSEAKILRAILSPAQLQEVMVDFWFNHFNVFAEKGLDKILVSSYERDAIRPYALGHFGDLLKATARHPAMLFYLDNWLNTDPDSPAAHGKKIGINENYAREIMELHTLGVNSGYTQQDVTTLAHILTGWGLGEGNEVEARAEFFFDPRRHDFVTKNFLGEEIPGSGVGEIDRVLDLLARHPSTAKHIAFEMAQYFVADNPPPSLVDRLAATFLATNGDIAAVIRDMVRSDEFWDPKYYDAKFKPPFRYIISALRATNIVPPGDTQMVQGALYGMGEPLYRCLTPNGYANTNDKWLNSDALLKRIDVSKKLANMLDASAPDTILQTMGNSLSPATRKTIDNADWKTKTTLLLSGPEFVSY